MTKLEKAIKGTECCNHIGREAHKGGCSRCPYRRTDEEFLPHACCTDLGKDVYELLNEKAIRISVRTKTTEEK